MKINKKLFVPFLSSVIGLSIAGGLGGAFAWYQYSSQVTTSFIGSSVADTSILQIGHLEENQTTHLDEMKWGRDYYPYQTQKQKLIPVTFGSLKTVGGKADSLRVEEGKNKAFGYPSAGSEVDNDYDGWLHIDPNDGFVQYDMYLRALDADGTQKALDVYLSNILIEAAGEAEGDKDITQAVRIHLNVQDDKNRLISKNEVTDLDLYGPLDLDGVDGPDVEAGDIVQSDMTDPDSDYKICTTKIDDATVKITVTVWLEGWDLLKVDAQGHTSNIWKPAYSAGVDIRLGMTFATVPVK